MDKGNLILHILSIAGFGILCFAAGMAFKAGDYVITLLQISIGMTVLEKTVHALIENRASNPKKGDDSIWD